MCCHPLASWTPSGPGSPGSSLPQGRKTGSTTHVLTVGAEAGGGTSYRILVHPEPGCQSSSSRWNHCRWVISVDNVLSSAFSGGGGFAELQGRTGLTSARRAILRGPGRACTFPRTARADSTAEALYVLAVACRSNPFLGRGHGSEG